MKNLKKIYISILIMLLFISFNQVVNANNTTYTNDDNSATWTINDQTVNYNNGVKHTLMYGTTTDKAYSTEGNQMVNAFEMKTDGVTSKLVTWAIQTGNGGYARNGLSIIAKNYEEKHPGWIVVAGINGDQYYTKYGIGLGTDGSFYYPNQPYYPMIIDGERRFPITATGYSDRNYVGIANNNQTNGFIETSSLDGLKIEILNENNEVIYIHNVDKVNLPANNNETSVWFAHPATDSSSNYVTYQASNQLGLYIVESAELAYMSNSSAYDYPGAADSPFGRGEITLITENYEIDKWQFAIDTNDSKLREQLSLNTRVRVQYYYENEQMNQVESSFGYHAVQRKDNVDVTTTAAYDTNRYNRSIFGQKADGTYVLMTVAKGTYSGTSHNESNTILKQLGVTEAYQQDGGGSVTAIIRNEYGDFDIVNKSSDSGSSQRSILNGCFFVIRDPGYASYQKDSTRTSITINRVNDYNKEYISNVVAEINNKKYQLDSDSLTINDLEDDTEYLVKLTYDFTINGITKQCSSTISAHTDSYKIPSSGIKIQNITASTVEAIRKKINDEEYIYVKLKLNNQEYDLTELDTPILIENLSKNKSYLYTVEYGVKDSFTGKIFENTEEYYFLTKKYHLPIIEEFKVERTEKDSVTINYAISDLDNLSYNIYIFYNNMQYPLEELSGSIVLDNLNIEENDYSFKLIVPYEEDNKTKEISSDIYTITKNDQYYSEVKENNCGSCNGCATIYIQLMFAATLIYIILKKK